jgi:hypothetical protein
MDIPLAKYKLIRPKSYRKKGKIERALKVPAPVLRAALDAQRQLSAELSVHVAACRAAGGDCSEIGRCIGDACDIRQGRGDRPAV